MNMNTNMKKCQIVLMTTVLLANIAAPLIANVQLVAADATTPKTTQAKTDDTTQAAAVKEQTAKRIAAVEKDWDAKTKASNAAANKEVEVFVQLKEAPAFKAAPAPTGTKSNIKAIKQHVQAVVDDQALTADVAENITGTKVKRQSGYLVNGFSIKATPKEVQKLEAQNTIEAVYPVQEYQVADTDALELGNAVKAWDSEGSEHKGDGIVIADIDTGIDVTHKDLSIDPTTPALTKDAVDTLKAEKNLPGKYYTAKVPYGYNYAENNDQIYDTGINSMHGMHVAGIMAADGTDYVKQQAYDKTLAETGSKKAAQKAKAAAHIEGNADVDGVAPHAQLLAMKVFGNNSANAVTPVIIKAIEDSVMLGADIMNLSLGSTCGGNADDIEEITLNNAAQLGVLAVVAAGNNGNYAGQHTNGTTQAKAIKEQETVGSPASALEALTVASENNSKRMVNSIEFADADGNAIFSDIKCDMNATASAVGFKQYDTNFDFQYDSNFNFANEGVSQVDGKRVSFNIAPISDSIAENRTAIDQYFANAKETGQVETKPTDQMAFRLQPMDDEYGKLIGGAKTVAELADIYAKWYPQPVAAGNLGRGYDIDITNGYKLADGTRLNYSTNNKILLISQGDFNEYHRSTMVRISQYQGIIIVADDENAKPGETSFDDNLEYDSGVPAVMVSHADGQKLADYFTTQAAADQTVQILRTPTRITSTKGGEMSYYSSWGLTPEMDFKPEITAPGGNIWSTLNNNQFGEMSGTSMATPFVSGAEALLLQDLKKTGLTGINKVRAAKVRMENSATPVYEEYTKDGKTIKAINSVRQQGAGAINVAKALANKTLLSVHNKMEGTLSLKQIKGSQSFKLDITNTSKTTKNYKLDAQTGQLYGQTTATAADNTTLNLHEYPIDQKVASITTPCPKQTFSVKAGATKTIQVNLNISKLQAKDSWLEGFFGIQEVGTDNTNVLPIVAYYGDLDKEPIVDDMATTEDSFYNYSSLSPNDFPLDGFGYTWNAKTESYTFDANDLWYSSNTNTQQRLETTLFYRTIALTRNAKTLHGYITDAKGKNVSNINTRTNLTRSWCYGSKLENALSYVDFSWGGDIVSQTTGERISAPDGEYTYHLDATSQMAGAKTQKQTLKIHIDTKKPVVSDVNLEQRADGYYLSGKVTDAQSGLGGFTSSYLTINGDPYYIAEGVLLGKERTKSQTINYKLTDEMAAKISLTKNTIGLSVQDFAHNWTDTVITPNFSDGKSSGFKIILPSQPTLTTHTDDYEFTTVFAKSNGDFKSEDPYGIFDNDDIRPYTYMESYNVNNLMTTEIANPDSKFDAVNHKLRIQGNSPDVFYVNGQKITPDEDGSYDAWVKYDPNKVKLLAAGWGDLQIVNFIYSTDAAGQDIIENRPVDLFAPFRSSPIPVVPDDVGDYDFTNPRSARTTLDVAWALVRGIFMGTGAEFTTSLGYKLGDDFSQFLMINTQTENFPATYNVAATSGDIHIVNKTAGETKDDPQTLVTKATPDATNVNRDLHLQEGYNIVECYADEAPTEVATSIIYYSIPGKVDDNALSLDSFNAPQADDWDAKAKQFTLRGIAGDNITGITVLGTSTDTTAPANQAKISNNQWSINVPLDADFGFKQWTMLVTYKDGKTYKYTIGGFYDFAGPTLKFDNTNKWTGNDKDGYDVYTKQTSFTFTGTASDNANGYSMYVNGTHVLTDAGESEGNLVAGTPHTFKETFNLTKNHLSSFEWKIFDRLDHVRFITVRVHQGNS